MTAGGVRARATVIAAIVGGYLSGIAAVIAFLPDSSLAGGTLGQTIMIEASRGGFFGLLYGWLPGAIAGAVHQAGARRATSSPGS